MQERCEKIMSKLVCWLKRVLPAKMMQNSIKPAIHRAMQQKRIWRSAEVNSSDVLSRRAPEVDVDKMCP